MWIPLEHWIFKYGIVVCGKSNTFAPTTKNWPLTSNCNYTTIPYLKIQCGPVYLTVRSMSPSLLTTAATPETIICSFGVQIYFLPSQGNDFCFSSYKFYFYHLFFISSHLKLFICVDSIGALDFIIHLLAEWNNQNFMFNLFLKTFFYKSWVQEFPSFQIKILHSLQHFIYLYFFII